MYYQFSIFHLKNKTKALVEIKSVDECHFSLSDSIILLILLLYVLRPISTFVYIYSAFCCVNLSSICYRLLELLTIK